MSVDPITESQQKKMKNEKQSTLDMFFNNKVNFILRYFSLKKILTDYG